MSSLEGRPHSRYCERRLIRRVALSQGVVERPMTAERLPLALRAYRLATLAGAPLAGLLLSNRLKRGKEDPARLAERRGETQVARPDGPLVWMHGASVGEVAAIIPLIERIVREGIQRPGHLRHRDLGQARRPVAAAGRHPSIRSARCAALRRRASSITGSPISRLFTESDLWPNLILMSAARAHSADPGQRPRVGALVQSLALRARHDRARCCGRFDLCLAQSAAYAARYRDLGAPRISTTGNLKLDVPEPPADHDSLRKLQAAIGDRADHRRGLDPCRRGDGADRDAPAVAPYLPAAADDHRAAPSRSRAGDRRDRAATPASPRRCARAGGCRSRRTTSTSSTRWASSGLVYRLAPIVFMGGSLASHGGQNPVEPIKLGAAVLHGPHVWNFAEIYAALDAAHGAELVADVGRLTVRVGALLTDARSAPRSAARRARPSSGSAVRSSARSRRSIPISCRSGWSAAAAMREPPFWWRPGGPAAAMLAPFAAVYGAVAARRMARPGAKAGVPVVCIGNPTVGGAGKTPAALAVARMLTADGETPGVPHAAAMADGSPARCGSIRCSIALPTSATSRCCWRALRPRSLRATACGRAGGGRRRRRASSSWTTASRTRRWPRIFPCWWSMAGAASATAGSFRPGRCGRRSARSLRARRR